MVKQIPSDRFYDDFELQFNYIGPDSTEQLYHHYSLSAQSKQYLSPDIYSARIKAPVIPGKDKYQSIADYLKKVVREKQNRRELSNVFYFAGHAYNADAIDARIDEGWVLKQHFPFLGAVRGKKLEFMNYDSEAFIKDRLKTKLADPTIDVAILHHHGNRDKQLLNPSITHREHFNGSQTRPNANTYLDYAKRTIRSSYREATDTVAFKERFKDWEIPGSWFNEAFDPEITKADSIFSASADLAIPDIYDLILNPKFVMIDACSTGSFQLDDYLSAHYIFNPGQTIVTRANSVNVLQDIWPNELIGLLSEGVCIGNWLKNLLMLEMHIIGDPTFHFASASKLDRDIVKEKNNPAYWRKLMKQADKADLRALALVMLQKNKAINSEELLAILKDDHSPLVRMEAFTLLKKRVSPLFPQALELAITDSYELLRRLAMETAAKSSYPELLPLLAKEYFNPAIGERVMFQLRYGGRAFAQYSADEVLNYLGQYRKDSPYWPAEKEYTELVAQIKKNALSVKEGFEKLNNPNEKPEKPTIPGNRLSHTQYLNELFDYLKKGENKDLRVLIAESLGWYLYSSQRHPIIAFCKQQVSEEKDEAVKNELQKTISRLSIEF